MTGHAWLAQSAKPDKADPTSDRDSTEQRDHGEPPPRNARTSLTGYTSVDSVVRAGNSPLSATGPVEVNEIAQVVVAVTW
jgi:hypothetical protein